MSREGEAGGVLCTSIGKCYDSMSYPYSSHNTMEVHRSKLWRRSSCTFEGAGSYYGIPALILASRLVSSSAMVHVNA
jgi:hypothetical protein